MGQVTHMGVRARFFFTRVLAMGVLWPFYRLHRNGHVATATFNLARPSGPKMWHVRVNASVSNVLTGIFAICFMYLLATAVYPPTSSDGGALTPPPP